MLNRSSHRDTLVVACCALSAVISLAAAAGSAQVRPQSPNAAPGNSFPSGPPKSPGPGPRPIGPEPGPGKVVSMLEYKSFCGPKTICQKSFAQAMGDARSFFKQNPTLNYTVTIPGGVFDLSDETTVLPGTKAMIDLSHIRPTAGHFTLKGAGSARTTLITANETTQFVGIDVSNVRIEGMTLRRRAMTTTQGRVVKAAMGVVTLQIPPGFPLVTEMFNPKSGNGNWLRVFDNATPLDPHMNVDPSNVQIHYGHGKAPSCAGRVCTVYLDPPSTTVPAIYTQPNQIVGVKSSKGGEAYHFDDMGVAEGANVGFNDVVWYDQGRGDFINFKGSFVTNSAIRRRAPIDGQGQAMSTSAGGPQFVTPKILPGTGGGTLVDHFTAEATGDDSIAVFNDTSTTTTLSNTVIANSFARTINLFNSCHVKLENNVGRYCSPQFDFPTGYKGCVTDTSHPGPTKCSPNL